MASSFFIETLSICPRTCVCARACAQGCGRENNQTGWNRAGVLKNWKSLPSTKNKRTRARARREEKPWGYVKYVIIRHFPWFFFFSAFLRSLGAVKLWRTTSPKHRPPVIHPSLSPTRARVFHLAPLAAASSSRPWFAFACVLWLMEGSGDDKSNTRAVLQPVKSLLTNNRAVNLIFRGRASTKWLLCCTSEYLGDVKYCLSPPIIKAL